VSSGLCLGLFGDPNPYDKARLIQLTLRNSAPSVACEETALLAELLKRGVRPNPVSPVAWASTVEDLIRFKGKLILCEHLDWLQRGASIALIEEEGRPAVYLNEANIQASGVQLPESVLHFGRKVIVP